MLVETERFGKLEIAPEALIEIPDGVYGFEQARRFCLIDHGQQSPFRWLQCVDAPGLAFVVVNPYDFFVNYQVEMEDGDAAAIGLREPEDAVILNLVTLGDTREDTTANLVGPIVLNAKSRKAKQVVLANQAYTTRHRLLPKLNGAPASSPGAVLDSTIEGGRAPLPIAAASGEDPCSSLRAAAERA